jgi:hypothetical protein
VPILGLWPALDGRLVLKVVPIKPPALAHEAGGRRFQKKRDVVAISEDALPKGDPAALPKGDPADVTVQIGRRPLREQPHPFRMCVHMRKGSVDAPSWAPIFSARGAVIWDISNPLAPVVTTGCILCT